LRQNRIPPPSCRSGLSWRKFLQAQASAIVVSDFFTVDTVFLKRFYILLNGVISSAGTSTTLSSWVIREIVHSPGV
ncbi:MAG TPA: hypothetical protein VLR46_14610, partial [Candidatus Dormibacteraeota bacterium]|nr:hypothetical protein [Candidatus Dormibacteraeota bacterium]